MVRAAVVLGSGHLYGGVAVQGDAYRVGAHALVIPERAGDETQVAGLGHDALVAHRLEHIARAVGQDHQKARAAHYVEYALHYGHRRVYELGVGLAYAAEHLVVHAPAQAAYRVHPRRAAAFPSLGDVGVDALVQLALVDVFGPNLLQRAQIFHRLPLQSAKWARRCGRARHIHYRRIPAKRQCAAKNSHYFGD